jgi:hypothetical protein
MAEQRITPAIEQAAQAVVNLINSRPHGPSCAEIAEIMQQSAIRNQRVSSSRDLAPEETSLPAQLRSAIAAECTASRACVEREDGRASDDAAVVYQQRLTELLALISRIPNQPRTFEDIVLLAEVAFHFAECDDKGRMAEIDDDDLFLSAAARVVQAVLDFAGMRHGLPSAVE